MQEVDFVVISEDYSRFLLKDGTLLKAKILIRKIFVSPVNTPEGYPTQTTFAGENIVVAIVPQSLKRPPSQEQFNMQTDVGEEVGFHEQKISNQEYLTDTGFRLLIRPVLTKVFKYQKYNVFGEPIYNVSMQQITNVEKTQSTAE